MPRDSPPVFTPQPFKLAVNIIKPAHKLKIAIESPPKSDKTRSAKRGGASSLISGGKRFTLEPGVGEFVESILEQMKQTERSYRACYKGDLFELGIHWHFGHCLELLAEELEWAQANGEQCRYQSIWNLIVLWAGDWGCDPRSCSSFENACWRAGLQPYSKAQFEFALNVFKNGKTQTPDHHHILPWRPDNWEPISMMFRKTNPPVLREMTVGISSALQSSQNDEFPLYDEPERRGGARPVSRKDSAVATAPQEGERGDLPIDQGGMANSRTPGITDKVSSRTAASLQLHLPASLPLCADNADGPAVNAAATPESGGALIERHDSDVSGSDVDGTELTQESSAGSEIVPPASEPQSPSAPPHYGGVEDRMHYPDN